MPDSKELSPVEQIIREIQLTFALSKGNFLDEERQSIILEINKILLNK